MSLSLRNKILSIVLLPCSGLVAFVAISIWNNYKDYGDISRASAYSKHLTAVSEAIHQIQKERGLTALYINNKITDVDLKAQRRNVDQEIDDVKTTLPNTEIKHTLSGYYDSFSSQINSARSVVDVKGSAAEAVKAFSNSIGYLISAEVVVANTARAFGDEKRLLSLTLLDIGKENTGKLRANVGNAITANAILTPQQSNMISLLLAGVNENLDSPALNISEESRRSLDAYKQSEAWRKSIKTVDFVLDNADKGKFNLDAKEFIETITAAINNLGEIISKEHHLVNSSIESNNSKIQRNFVVVILLNVVLLAAIFWLSAYFIRSINGPIQELMDRLTLSSKHVGESSQTVSSASGALSQNSTQQAAALQEAVASVEEITQMIAKTASNARESQEVSRSSSETAKEGRRIVEELNHSITGISESNEKIKDRVLKSNVELEQIAKIISEIGDKTKVINDIVFQTKLLSFNASVEAARAGEQGKGFAVVAEEVGNLAVMSGHAAEEITQFLGNSMSLVEKTIENTKREVLSLMEKSNQTIETGVESAKKCGSTLAEVVEKAEEVNRLVVEIATASDQQSQGMVQISEAMTQLDSATHANSASAVETAKYGDSLKTQSKELDGAIQDLSQLVYGSAENSGHAGGNSHAHSRNKETAHYGTA